MSRHYSCGSGLSADLMLADADYPWTWNLWFRTPLIQTLARNIFGVNVIAGKHTLDTVSPSAAVPAAIHTGHSVTICCCTCSHTAHTQDPWNSACTKSSTELAPLCRIWLVILNLQNWPNFHRIQWFNPQNFSFIPVHSVHNFLPTYLFTSISIFGTSWLNFLVKQ